MIGRARSGFQQLSVMFSKPGKHPVAQLHDERSQFGGIPVRPAISFLLDAWGRSHRLSAQSRKLILIPHYEELRRVQNPQKEVVP